MYHAFCLLAAQVALFLPLLVRSAHAHLLPRASVCNGHPQLCGKLFSNVTYIGAHNSYTNGVNNLAVNQDVNVTKQLDDGIRMLQLQVHNDAGTLRLCHTKCALFNGGSLENYLKLVKTWLDANPNEVLSILIVNSDGFTPTDYDRVYKAAGMDTLSFVPPVAALPASNWPTLGSMIDSQRRVVTFLDNGANFAVVPYLMDEFTNVWETAFDVTDTSFNCDVNRTKGDPATQMFLINHFLDTIRFGNPSPDIVRANITNSVDGGDGALGRQTSLCAAQHGKNPTFILVDFYEFGGGSVFQVAATANGVTYTPTVPIATPQPTGTSSASGAQSMTAPSSSLLLLKTSLLVLFGMTLGVWSVV